MASRAFLAQEAFRLSSHEVLSFLRTGGVGILVLLLFCFWRSEAYFVISTFDFHFLDTGAGMAGAHNSHISMVGMPVCPQLNSCGMLVLLVICRTPAKLSGVPLNELR